MEKLSENGNSDHYGNFPNGKGVLWIDELSKNAGMERRTVQNWWSSFTKSAGLSITPKQATDENRQAFFAWLEAQKQAEVGRIILKLQENSNETGNSNLENQWILELAKNSGISQPTAYNWWAAITVAAIDATPQIPIC